MNHSVLCPLTLSVVALSSSAQSFPTGDYDVTPADVRVIAWPSGLGAHGTFHSAHLAPFFGNQSPDGALHAGDRAFLLFQPEFQRTIVEVGTGVLDVAPVPGVKVSDPTGLAMARSSGIDLYTPGLTTTIATTGWQNVTILRPANLDSAGKGDLVGAIGDQVRFLTHNGTSWSSSGAITAYGTVLDACGVDWDGDQDDEAALLTTSGLEVRSPSGTVLDFFAGAATAGKIAALPPMFGHTVGRVAWSFPTATNKVLAVCNPGGARESCGALSAAPAALASAYFQDASGSRRVDLLTSAEADLKLRYFKHQASGNPFAAAAPDVTFEVGTGSPSACRIAFNDITGDKVADALVPRESDDAIYFVPGLPPSFGGLEYTTLQPFVDPELVLDEDGLWFQTHLILPPPNPAGNPPNPPGYPYTHVQIQLWKSADGVTLESMAIANSVFEFGSFPPENLSAHMKIALLVEEDVESCELANGYYFTMRLVTLDQTAQPARVNTFSAAVDAGFATSEAILEEMEPDPELRIDLELCSGDEIGPSLVKRPKWAELPPPLVPTVPPIDDDPHMPGLQ